MIDREQWPAHLEVRAKLGGKEGNNFGWHVGISVGRVKILFHPGLGGGAFRAETTDDHKYLTGNESMGFTPAAEAIHEMIIKVAKRDNGTVFDITVRDADSDAVHKRTLTFSNEQLGEYNRIGLERSGRRGADAMFDSVSIKLRR